MTAQTTTQRTAKHRLAVKERLQRYEAALEAIAEWQLPETGKFWLNVDGTTSDRPMSYGACLGSNGERDFIRSIALEALSAPETPTTTPKIPK